MFLKDIHQKFQDYLDTNASRYTSQKRDIVSYIAKEKEHFEVDDFLAKLRKKNKRFSRATVYRTIKQLLDAQLIQKIQALDGRVLYEQNFEKKQHDHVICNSCGKILEIDEEKLDKLYANYCKNIHFKPEYRSVHIYGTCQDCQSATA